MLVANNRHVMLPKETAKVLPKSRLLTEEEWRNLGVQQSRGWQHYAIHRCVHVTPTLWAATVVLLLCVLFSTMIPKRGECDLDVFGITVS